MTYATKESNTIFICLVGLIMTIMHQILALKSNKQRAKKNPNFNKLLFMGYKRIANNATDTGTREQVKNAAFDNLLLPGYKILVKAKSLACLIAMPFFGDSIQFLLCKGFLLLSNIAIDGDITIWST